MKARGATMVREVIADEHREMQARAYKRLRPYLAGSLFRLRRAHPAFKTVVFNAEKADFALIFVDGTRPHEAPKAFGGLKAACKDLSALSEIEWLTAGDSLWQMRRGTSQPECVIEQYRHIESDDWQLWMRRPLREARYYMRQDIYSRTVYGSHRPGYGKRIVGEDGAVVDEWVDPIEPMVLRALREIGKPTSLEPLCRALNAISGFRDSYFIWDVLRACGHLVQKRALRRIDRKLSECSALFVLATPRKRKAA